jgi:signal transduction histidine kinase
MTKETKEKILNSDIHSSLKGTSGEQGTGLGLILIKEFIKLHNGIFDIESEINVGSKFIIGFPKIK